MASGIKHGPFVPANNARPRSGPSIPPFRRQSSSLVVPPYRYVDSTYLLYFSLLRKHRGCGGILPILGRTGMQASQRANASLFRFFSSSCALFCSFLHFFALTENSTLFFSSDSALFAKKPGGGVPLPPNFNMDSNSRRENVNYNKLSGSIST